MLLTAGANPLAINHAGNTILHELVRNYASGDGASRVTIMNLFLKLGVSTTAQNYLGQTPLHIACGSKPTQHLGSKVDPFDFILNCHIDSINTGDFHGVRPIHLAATISEQNVATLIRNGADCSISTHEGRNLLHIASRARQSNVVGLILEHFLSIGHLDPLNSQDKLGRTPLHDACRSGRPETVALLLKAGADPKIKDKQNYTPLHACAEFEEESIFWSDLANQLAPKRILDAAGVLISDPLRPDLKNRTGSGQSGPVSCDNDSVRIREIIRLLIAHGAELAFPSPMIDPIGAAIVKRCADMVDDLLPLMEAIRAKAAEEKRLWHMAGTRRSSTHFQERNMAMQWRATVEESDIMKNETNPWLCNELLKMRQFSAIEQLSDMGVDFSPKVGYGNDFLTTLAQWGYASLFEKLGATISRSHWVDGIESPEHDLHKTLTPYLITAARSVLPNLDMIKVIVETFGANVNIQHESRVYQSNSGHTKHTGQSALHILVRADHWWHSGAIEYLLEHGANTELRNESGLSVLHLAVGSNYESGGYRQREVVKLLLKYGADPNSMDATGLTCLNSAIHDVELVRLLIEHGADICGGRKPVLFSAISKQDVIAVRVILEAGADCNIRQEKPKTYAGKGFRIHEYEYYPIHYAADSQFNNPKTRSTAIEIIKLLLDKGANPYLQFREDSTILHDIFQFGGIIEPFLEIPDLDLEYRDPQGRTLLLASCLSACGIPLNLYKKGSDLSATDNKDNNALHLLLLAKRDIGEEYKKTFGFFIQEAPELVHQKNIEGWKPLHYAFQQRRVWSSVTLLDAGADPLEPDPNGDTPLHFIAPVMLLEAGQAEWLPRFKRFLDLGININARNNKGETPLFAYIANGNCFPGGFPWSVKDGHRLFYKPFEDAGAEIFTRNNDGENLLHLTAKRAAHSHMGRLYSDRVDTFKFLMEKGLDPMEEDNNQRTALVSDFAC
jgi:ankyrin repeat protein